MPAAGSIGDVEDPGAQQRGVEPVAGAGEVGLRGGGPQARVDADEQQPQRLAGGREEVGHLHVAEGLELGPGEPHGCHPAGRSDP